MAAHAVKLQGFATPSGLTTTRAASWRECQRTKLVATRPGQYLHKGETRGKRVADGAARCCKQDEQAKAEGHQKAGRRDVLLAGAAALVAGTTLPRVARSEDAPIVEAPKNVFGLGESPPISTTVVEDTYRFGVLKDDLNAYQFKYPLETAKKRETLPWVETRAPERYSSAAPISSDARQRIVSERIDFTKSVTCTVSVGPPSEIFLKGTDPTGWKATAVANSVLMDRSSRRMSQGQRTAESEIEETRTKTIDGVPYFFYEHIQQRSPTTIEKRSDTFRHSYAVTAEREGYLYTLNISTPDVYWEDLEPVFRQAVESFRLLPPTKDYVPPWKDPWRFW
ncbi:hypothetical protein KFL_003170080 [Klebsormidium nitens]|uniref:PsbP C-terminal domain-containing protein n=1 Tax=Klebsormidium nitens TaxID=105231 RepID=A0A1Y1IBR5_KLENI|nr:hypothetical protein KFL_003170080 [Klebsormidium nitens]|eukprot:GAQ86869.1 hypothetical protein KFL_003170080 [Klebsormidium nitens]